jgi:hypothetical protein
MLFHSEWFKQFLTYLLTVLFVLLCVGFFLIRNLTDVNYLYFMLNTSVEKTGFNAAVLIDNCLFQGPLTELKSCRKHV